MITPAFHFEILDDFLHVMNEQAEIMIEILTDLSKKEKEINIFQKLCACALDIISGIYKIFNLDLLVTITILIN